jgi:nicotinamide mononucleotide (NMN) deamidase PncC
MHVNTNRTTSTSAPSLEDALFSTLQRYGVDHSGWENRDGKIRKLSDDISTGECELMEVNGKLCRVTQRAVVAINGNSPSGVPLTLTLDRETLSNGRSLHNLSPWSVIERLLPKEDPALGALRGLERTFSITPATLTYRQSTHKILDKNECPGLPAVETSHEFSVDLGIQGQQKGYVASTDSSTTFFEWRPIEGELTKRACDAYLLPLATLRDSCAKIASKVHSILLDAAKRREFGGLVTAEIGTAGGVSAALTSFDGSSKYVKGGLAMGSGEFSELIRSSSEWLPSFTKELEKKVVMFAETHALSHVLPVTTTILPNLPYGYEFGIKVGDLQKQFFMPTPGASESALEGNSGTEETFERARLVGTLLTLELIQEVIAEEWPTPLPAMNEIIGSLSPVPSPSPLTDLIDEVRTANQNAWEVLRVVLAARRQTLALGESFTGGKLREHCSRSADGAMDPSVSTFYLWYDPMWKVAAGVPPECVTDARITSTETAELGAMGLLHTIAKEAHIALATTGWANNRPEAGADQFSVAIASRCFDSNLTSRSMYVDVTVTEDMPPSLEKRALTRELGVAAALSLLADQLNETYEPIVRQETFDRLIEARRTLAELLDCNTFRKTSR